MVRAADGGIIGLPVGANIAFPEGRPGLAFALQMRPIMIPPFTARRRFRSCQRTIHRALSRAEFRARHCAAHSSAHHSTARPTSFMRAWRASENATRVKEFRRLTVFCQSPRACFTALSAGVASLLDERQAWVLVAGADDLEAELVVGQGRDAAIPKTCERCCEECFERGDPRPWCLAL